MRLSIRDVADAAGVSSATVSRVLNGNPSVSPDLAERVKEVVDRLGYRPHGAARNLRRQVSDIWAVVLPDVENPFFTSLLRGLENAAHESGLATVVCNSDEDPDKEATYLQWAIAHQVAGLIIAAAPQAGTPLEEVLAAGIPTVAVDRDAGADVDLVVVDNRYGAFEATRHLLDQGATRLACITGPSHTTTGVERAAGFLEAADHLPPSGRRVIEADFRQEGGHAAMTHLLRSDVLPDAVFVANNLMTVGALEAATDLGVKVGSELLLVAFDDIPWSRLVSPSLTCIVQPSARMGQLAGELLRERTSDPSRPARRVALRPELRVGESSVRRTR